MSSIKNNILQFPKVKSRRVEVTFTQARINKLLAKKDLKVGTSIYDKKRKGLLIHVGKLGLKYRSNGRIKGGSVCNVIIGDVATTPIKQAFQAHADNYMMFQNGLNPNEERRKRQQAEAPMDTIVSMIEALMKRQQRMELVSPKTTKLRNGLLNNYLRPFLGNKTFEDITPRQWETFLMDIPNAVGKNCMKLISTTYNSLSAKEQRDTENPMKIARRRDLIAEDNSNRNIVMDVTPDNSELGLWFKALELYRYGWSPDDDYVIPPTSENDIHWKCLLFILLTGVRHDSALSLTWDNVDYKNHTMTFEEKGKRGKKNIVTFPMTDYHHVLLKSLKKEGKTVFNITQSHIEKACIRIGMLMCYWRDDRPKVLTKIIKNKTSTSIDDYSRLVKETRGSGKQSQLVEHINSMGVKPHGLRRALGNIASILGIADSVQLAMLSHSEKGVHDKHYRTIQQQTMKDSFQSCGRYIDNRIAEYVGTTHEGKEEGRAKLQSPIFKMLGLQVAINQDGFYQSGKQIFPEEKEFKIGD